MAGSEKKKNAKSDDPFTKRIESLDEETFLKNLNLSYHLVEEKAVKKRLELIGGEWKRRIEAKKTRVALWEHTLYLVHLCPRLLETPGFQ